MGVVRQDISASRPRSYWGSAGRGDPFWNAGPRHLTPALQGALRATLQAAEPTAIPAFDLAERDSPRAGTPQSKGRVTGVSTPPVAGDYPIPFKYVIEDTDLIGTTDLGWAKICYQVHDEGPGPIEGPETFWIEIDSVIVFDHQGGQDELEAAFDMSNNQTVNVYRVTIFDDQGGL